MLTELVVLMKKEGKVCSMWRVSETVILRDITHLGTYTQEHGRALSPGTY
jgi:hypothetical protein